jgi:acyl-CoA reductase-like NAD-dependent aldehyde dehydrogenase
VTAFQNNFFFFFFFFLGFILSFFFRPEQVRSSIAQWPCRSEVRKEPKGVVLAMSPWNYPLNLAIVPIAGALAGEIFFVLVLFSFVKRLFSF